MLEKVLKSFVLPDSELTSPMIPQRSTVSSPTPSSSAASSNDDNAYGRKIDNRFVLFFVVFVLLRTDKKLPLSMTTPIPRPTAVRRPWSDYLKSNRERWVREAGLF